MKNGWKTKEVVVIAMIAAVVGVLYTLMDYAYMPLSAVLGTVFMELTFGIYLLSAALPMYIVRKPGFAVYGALVTAGVNLLLGSPYGIQLILAGVLQAIGIEIGYALFGKYEGNMKNMVIGAILGALLVFSRDALVFGTLTYGAKIVTGIIIVRLLSAAIIGTLLVKGITAALNKTGVLRGFACAKK
ncbi:MAG: ECF transporter S component [Muricomes sp.]